MTNRPATTRIAMVAGEASGDLLASLLLAGLRTHELSIELPETFGIGGPRMIEQGFQALWPMEKLAVRGYIEVLRHYPEIAHIRRQLRGKLIAQPPNLFIGVDAPDFNLDLAIALKQAGIATIQFVSPSIWAWRGERIDKIRAAVNHMLVLFPFEVVLYQQAGIPVTFVGHPLADVIPLQPDRRAARQSLGLSVDDLVLALLPGSRLSEIEMIAPLFIAAAREIHQHHAQIRLITPMASAKTRALFEKILATFPDAPPIQIVAGQSHTVLAGCDATLVASGTATLEAALFKRPMVIAYRMARLSWWFMKPRHYQPWVGLPNILAEEFLVPELIQDAATPHALAQATLKQLYDDVNRATLEKRFLEIHLSLRQNTAQRAATTIRELLMYSRDRIN